MLIESALLFFDDPQFRVVGDGIEKKRPLFRLLFKLIGWLSRTTLGNVFLISAAILGYRPFRRPGSGPLFQYGWSKNNVRVFQRINAAAGHPEWDASINGKPLPLAQRLAVLGKFRALGRMASALTTGRAVAPFVHAQVTLLLASRLVYSCEDFADVRCVCVASDHSPIVMGLLDVVRGCQIRICYAQHAPVADYFPPLDYDLSILFDRASMRTYERAAARRQTLNKGRIALLPPFDADAVSPVVPSPPFKIGLCLSYVFNQANVSNLIEDLKAHPAVAQIHLRRHPRCKADISLFSDRDNVIEPNNRTISDFADGCDLILVPNSGVAIELLHLGKPVLYTPDMDYIANDYYGFVEFKIVPEFNFMWLDDPTYIATFFGQEWRKSYMLFDESISTPLRTSREAAGQALLSLLG